MMIRLSSHFLTLFALLNVFCSRTSGFPALGTYSHLGLRNAVGFDGQSSEDQSQSPVGADSGVYQNPLSDSDKVYYQFSASMPRAKRHSDAIFTNDYNKLLGEIAARIYLELLMGKRTQDEKNTSKRHDDGSFTDLY
ncbi:VIP peptides-like [Hemiscyllium ocellatum]|uniref:VIP peptides-like n=1 Tax=Hemiscyllium ocellatum TaxID=170820 RepID=UPI0029664D46|nr:VIP peptides-like [Hemiscyllium ocellatum]